MGLNGEKNFGIHGEMREKKEEYTVMHLGGSIVVPHISDEGGMNTSFLKKFKTFLVQGMKRSRRFVIVAGGGKTARAYQKGASRIVDVRAEDLDWLGIHATRQNAHFLRTIFAAEAYPVVIDHDPYPEEMEMFKSSRKKLFFASGWRPGWSTDYITVKLAERFGSKEVIIAKDTPFVYNKDPKKHEKAIPIHDISWKEYKKLIPKTWTPGLSSPVDPVATRFAEEQGIVAKVLGGTDLVNLKKAIEGKEFQGTVIW